MPPPGPRPQPTALKLAKGTRSDRVNASEPRVARATPDCPAYLGEHARQEWARVTAELEGTGVLALTDRSALALYCEAFSDWIKAKHEIDAVGLTVSGAQGGTKINPAVTVKNNAASLMARLLVEFGLTASSRSRLSVPPPAEVDELADLIATRKKAK